MNPSRNENEAAVTGRTEPEWNAASSDAELVRAARQGDKRAFVEIVARHQAMVCGIAFSVLEDFAASEDAAQEAFLTAWLKIHELREPERLRAWLGQIARHAALGHRRRQRGHGTLEEASDLSDHAPAPDESAASEEEAALVRDALARLPQTYREPLILYYREQRSTKAVAETLDISEDAVRQRLARGREMLRDRMSGLIESVLTRTGPTPMFTMAMAVAIGALPAPAVVAGSVFTATAASTTSTAASPASILTTMSTSKTLLVTVALVTVLGIPIGYHLPQGAKAPVRGEATSLVTPSSSPVAEKTVPSFEDSSLFAEWRELHETYGTTAEAMPKLYQAIATLPDPFRRRAFHTALMAEWVQVDPVNGLAFFLNSERDAAQRRQFFEEWLAHDARAAVDTLMAGGPGWEDLARYLLPEIARRVPERVPEIAARLPKPESYWDTKVREAFALVAERDLAFIRPAAEAMSGPSRDQALAGVAQAWAKNDLNGALAWARSLPDGTDRDEIIRAALVGRATTDPVGALEQVGLVPPGGRQTFFASTAGARVLKEAAQTDFDATVAWLAAHPGRFGHEDMMGLAHVVTTRLNANAFGFLQDRIEEGSLAALLPAIRSALMNDASGQRSIVWDWLKTQPDSEAITKLRKHVLDSTGYEDPDLALRLAAEWPRVWESEEHIPSLVNSLLNGGSMLHRLDKLMEQSPETLRQPLIETAFNYLSEDNLDDPQQWINRLALLPDATRARGVESIARVWANQSPEEAIAWVGSLAAGETRSGALAAVTSSWAEKDARGAAEWVAQMLPGAEWDRSAGALVKSIATRFPQEAWEWSMNIGDTERRRQAAGQAAQAMAAHDPVTARHWIETGPFTPEAKAQLHALLAPTDAP